jgi:hypothetical protein
MAYKLAASSTDIKWVFSHGGLTVSKMQHSLADTSVKAATMISSWCDFPKFIPRNELAAAFNDKGKHNGEKGKDSDSAIDPDVVIVE